MNISANFFFLLGRIQRQKFDCFQTAKRYGRPCIFKCYHSIAYTYFETCLSLQLLSTAQFCFYILQYQELYTRKPKEGEEDPVLVEEIRKARENVGMYTRKTSLEYEENNLIRFENHKAQLIMLLNQVPCRKMVKVWFLYINGSLLGQH